MDAQPTQVWDFFNGTKQMLVPLFQRSYEWKEEHWETFWTDLFEQYESSNDDALASHFMGAIVTAPAKSVPVGVSKFLIIDGQQRLTTFAILLCAIRSFRDRETPNFRKLTRLLVNEDEEGLDYFKLLPTQIDRLPFKYLIESDTSKQSRFSQALNYFVSKFKDATDSENNNIDLDRFTAVVQTRVNVVSINLGDNDDPYLIFESLNAKGAPLTQADLIRNYLLLRLRVNSQQTAYDDLWLPMQNLLGSDNLTEFMRQYLMLDGNEIAKSAIYAILKRRLLSIKDDAVYDELAHMKELAENYACIINHKNHSSDLIARALQRLTRWSVTVANPFLLKLLEATDAKQITEDVTVKCFAIIESFVVRRTICNVPSNQLKRIFLSLTQSIPVQEVAKWLSKNLTEGVRGRRWPDDNELHEAIGKYQAYSSSEQVRDRCKFILENIEQQYDHKEPVNFVGSTIEHIMPQALNQEWQMMLGDNFSAIHLAFLHSIGNLTLTGYNSELSNLPFANKREQYSNSHYEINKWISRKEQWGENEIHERLEEIYQKMLKIWPHPGK